MFESVEKIAAPMVNQSDLPFRLLVSKYGATMTYTQMLISDKVLNDEDYLNHHLHDLQSQRAIRGGFNGAENTVVVQLSGNDPETIVSAGKKLQGYCDAIGESCTWRSVLRCGNLMLR